MQSCHYQHETDEHDWQEMFEGQENLLEGYENMLEGYENLFEGYKISPFEHRPNQQSIDT